MPDTKPTAAVPWAASAAAPLPRKRVSFQKLLPFIGPVALFILWDMVIRLGFIKPILLPTPAATLEALVRGLAGGPLLTDFAVTVMRTLQAFLIAAVLGVPLGVLLGSNER